MSASIVFHLFAAVVYAGLGLWVWSQAIKAQAAFSLTLSQRIVLALALVLHGSALVSGLLPQHSLFLGWALAMSAAIWLGMIIFFFHSLRNSVDGLLLILLPACTLVSVLASLFPSGHIVPHAHNDWLRIHLLIAFTAYGLIFIAALQAILMAALDKHLHTPVSSSRHRPLVASALDALPPLLVQEHLLFQLIRIAFLILTLTVISGAIVSMLLSSELVPFDHKTIFTLLSWLTLGGLLWGRHTQGWRGRIALRWILTGFAFVVLAYTGSRFVMDVIL